MLFISNIIRNLIRKNLCDDDTLSTEQMNSRNKYQRKENFTSKTCSILFNLREVTHVGSVSTVHRKLWQNPSLPGGFLYWVSMVTIMLSAIYQKSPKVLGIVPPCKDRFNPHEVIFNPSKFRFNNYKNHEIMNHDSLYHGNPSQREVPLFQQSLLISECLRDSIVWRWGDFIVTTDHQS